MIINTQDIEKLKVLKVSASCIIVENLQGQKGSIFISEVSDSFIVDLNQLYKKGDTVYGALVRVNGYKRYYSLKVGHTSDSKYVTEVGGGCLGLLYTVNKAKDKY